MLPETFGPFGILTRDNEVTFRELYESLFVKGPTPPKPGWEEGWRRGLLENAEILVRQLWADGAIPFPDAFRLIKGKPTSKGLIALKKD